MKNKSQGAFFFLLITVIIAAAILLGIVIAMIAQPQPIVTHRYIIENEIEIEDPADIEVPAVQYEAQFIIPKEPIMNATSLNILLETTTFPSNSISKEYLNHLNYILNKGGNQNGTKYIIRKQTS